MIPNCCFRSDGVARTAYLIPARKGHMGYRRRFRNCTIFSLDSRIRGWGGVSVDIGAGGEQGVHRHWMKWGGDVGVVWSGVEWRHLESVETIYIYIYSIYVCVCTHVILFRMQL